MIELKCNKDFYINGKVCKETYYYVNVHRECFVHNENGPAIIYYDQKGIKISEFYYKHNELHNINGPAQINYDYDEVIEKNYYFINNKFINVKSDEEFKQYIKLQNIL